MIGSRGARAPKNPKTCHERALGLLAVRPRSIREVRDRLRRAGFEQEEVEDTISRLEGAGLLNDEAFAREFAEHAFSVRGSGRIAVVSGLMAKGVSRETIERVLEDTARGDDSARAEELARGKAGRMRGLETAVAFRRLTSFLMRRGYTGAVAREAAARALALRVDET